MMAEGQKDLHRRGPPSLGLRYIWAKPEEGQKILELLEKQKPAVKVYNAEGSADRMGKAEVAMHLMWNGA